MDSKSSSFINRPALFVAWPLDQHTSETVPAVDKWITWKVSIEIISMLNQNPHSWSVRRQGRRSKN